MSSKLYSYFKKITTHNICPLLHRSKVLNALLNRLDDRELSVIEATVNGLCKAKEPEE